MRRLAILLSILAALLIGPAGWAPASRAEDATPDAGGGAAATGILHDTTGRAIGAALLAERADGSIDAVVAVSGLPPGAHGMHAHEVGACDPGGDQPFASAGGHFNPTGAEHGQHAGDLGNIHLDRDGIFHAHLPRLRQFALTSGPSPLLDADGASIVIHSNADKFDPEGTSYGARIACVVLSARGAAGTPAASSIS